jgi:radical SAM superfamily enzyme YgiQ (UPF0313 family)
MGHAYRYHSPERVVDEMEYVIDKFGVKQIHFKDAEFTLSPARTEKICDLLIERDMEVIWDCNGRVNNVRRDILQKMKKAGCVSMTYGIESGDQRILDALKKEITLEQAREAVKMTKEAGLEVVVNFMVGNPGETEESLERTISFAKELDADYAYFGNLVPFPGTELRELAEKNNWLLDTDMGAVRYERVIMNATELQTEELKTCLNRAYRSFYLRPSYIIKRLAKLNLMNIRNYLGGFKSIMVNTMRKNW